MLDLEFSIDFKGQEVAESYINYILYSSIPVSFLVGLISQELKYCVYSFGGFIILSLLVVLPNYPFYNKNPVNWLQVKYV